MVLGDSLLVVGYSARALAESASRAGYPVVALDYFGDLDTCSSAVSLSLAHTFHLPFDENQLTRIALTLPSSHVVYTGGLENYPRLLDRLARHHVLLGNPSTVTRRVRDWRWLARFAEQQGLKFPETYGAKDQLPSSKSKTKSWLVKPIASGGGRGIRFWDGTVIPKTCVLQRFIQGIPISVQALGNGHDATYLGCTRQLVGIRSFGAKRFQYAGNIFPFDSRGGSASSLESTASQLVNALVRTCGIRGLFGVDGILAPDGLHLLEVNPRPTAVIDLLDQAYQCSFLQHHVQACITSGRPSLAPIGPEFFGKCIFYARAPTLISDTCGWRQKNRKDIPWSGEQISTGNPICSSYAQASSSTSVLTMLKRDARVLYRELK